MDNVSDKRIHANDYKEVREKYLPHAVDTSDDKLQDIIVRIAEPTGARGPDVKTGTWLFADFFHPRSVRKMMTKQRVRYLELLDNEELPWLYMVAHRGFGKTTLAILFCQRVLALRYHPFILFTSSEYKIATKRTEAIRSAFLRQDIQGMFKVGTPRRNQKATAAFSEESFFLIDQKDDKPFACINPRGANQTVNGSIAPLRSGFQRVSLVLNDDGQSRRHIGNSDVRETYEEWVEAELMNTVEVDEQPGEDHVWHRPEDDPYWRSPWRHIFLDTIKHRRALIAQYVDGERPQWQGEIFPMAREVAEGKYKSCTELMTDGQVQAAYERLRTKPDYWAREFLCKPSSGEAAIYKSEMFRWYSDVNLVRRRRPLIKFIIVDPARSGSDRANPTSIKAVGIDTEEGRIYIRENIVDRMEPEVYYAETFDMCRRLNTGLLYVEKTGLGNVIVQAFKQAASLAGMDGQITFDWLESYRSAGVDYGSGPEAIKRARAAAMLPFVRMGAVFFDESLRGGPLEKALLDYPECTEWDATDTFGYIPEVMERLHIYLEGVQDVDEILDDEESEDYDAAGEYFASRAWCT